jgi:hypothetical protein
MRSAPSIGYPAGLSYTNASAGGAINIQPTGYLFGATATALGVVDVLGIANISAEL